jgi:putative ABC transport system ATP-binding protein
MAEMSVAVRCDRLVKLYWAASGETQALRGVEAEFPTHTLSAITGPSGSGKSTLLSIVALNERPTAGDLELFGHSVGALSRLRLGRLRRRTVAWIPQRPSEALLPSLRVHEQVRQATRLRSKEDIDEALESLHLLHRRRAWVDQLSGGEQQRLAVLLATRSGTPVVVADEPTAELDDDSADLVLDHLHGHAAAGSCVVMATHDDRAISRADRVLALRHGVLSSEHRSGRTLVPIDSSGRLQLPPSARAVLSEDRVELLVHEDHIVIRRPQEDR